MANTTKFISLSGLEHFADGMWAKSSSTFANKHGDDSESFYASGLGLGGDNEFEIYEEISSQADTPASSFVVSSKFDKKAYIDFSSLSDGASKILTQEDLDAFTGNEDSSFYASSFGFKHPAGGPTIHMASGTLGDVMFTRAGSSSTTISIPMSTSGTVALTSQIPEVPAEATNAEIDTIIP